MAALSQNERAEVHRRTHLSSIQANWLRPGAQRQSFWGADGFQATKGPLGLAAYDWTITGNGLRAVISPKTKH
ncbi:hypothetical protein DACRYDRAFT_23236 [Dacryopinax primogenitus]|uniref:Uncharacterized protein n=1 Tax=Dacryopinax primogenitus (strain DJM 731) TaxID=1858805 RepID=M5FVH6_DACPD|nr:uncharacterized protein DACRYDRAFT_23236 [Dacryopinax primogenitus]EJU00299.1 hypothetical protein DACRYDRAFT_23236 [Dacryopinax primogenitus]